MLRSRAKHFFWVLANLYGRVFGRAGLASFHNGLLIFALHGLGYDNGWRSSYTGEEWFIQHILHPSHPRTCIDIGANVGDYCTLLLQNTTGQVYAFEPAKSTFAELVKIQLLYPQRFFPINKAVSDVVGQASLFSAGEKSPTASLDARLVKDASHETVAMTTLDAFVEEKKLSDIDFIKVDVEGYEREVFKGMQKTIRANKPKFIQFEFNVLQLRRGYTLLELTFLLEGYTFYRLLPRGWVKIDPQSFSSNIFMFCNIVAVRYT